MKFKSKISLSFIFRMLGILFLFCFLLSILWVVYYSKYNVRYTPQMVFYDLEKGDDTLQYKVEYEWISLDSMSRNIIIAALAGEDKDFYVHNGFSTIDVDDSIVNLVPKRHETITQKTAHAVFLTKNDSKIKDILEPYFTILEEYLWGKERILEMYLNTSSVGKGIFGVEAASRIYFNKSAGDLTRQEAAFIAALMEREDDNVDVMNPPEELLQHQRELLLRMAFIIHLRLGKRPVDEVELTPSKPIYKRNWRG